MPPESEKSDLWLLLSHHRKENLDRCFSPRIGGRTVHLCGRCTGVYLGLGFLGFLALSEGVPWHPVFYAGGIPVAIEKLLSENTGFGHHPVLKALTGVAAGFCFYPSVAAVTRLESPALAAGFLILYAAVGYLLLFVLENRYLDR